VKAWISPCGLIVYYEQCPGVTLFLLAVAMRAVGLEPTT